MGPPVHEDLSLGETHKGQITNEVQQLMGMKLNLLQDIQRLH